MTNSNNKSRVKDIRERPLREEACSPATEMSVFSSAPPRAEAFYAECLRLLSESGIPFLLGGSFAVSAYTGSPPPEKDLDVFCKAGDYPRILAHFRGLGYDTEVEDERWIAKIKRDGLFVDVIFNSTIAIVPVTEQWFENAVTVDVSGRAVPVLSPTELIWSKVFVQDRCRYDGADVVHVILTQCENIDWRRLLSHMEQYWEAMLAHLINFRFVYPTERHRIPRWLMDELIDRLQQSLELPIPRMKICRGRLFSRNDYYLDISQWGFADLIGEGGKSDANGE